LDKVLIVDSDPESLKLLKKGLEKYKGQFEVLTAPDGKEAIEISKKKRISVLVTDIVMPKLDGLQLLAHMAKNHPQIPCIVIAGPGDPEIKKTADGADIFRYIEKPFDFNEFVGAIMEGLERLDEGVFYQNSRHGT